MKNVGITRKVDDLGRIVIPKELRDKFSIKEKDALEINVNGNLIILKKYEPTCIFCENSKNLVNFKEKLICNKCISKIMNI